MTAASATGAIRRDRFQLQRSVRIWPMSLRQSMMRTWQRFLSLLQRTVRITASAFIQVFRIRKILLPERQPWRSPWAAPRTSADSIRSNLLRQCPWQREPLSLSAFILRMHRKIFFMIPIRRSTIRTEMPSLLRRQLRKKGRALSVPTASPGRISPVTEIWEFMRWRITAARRTALSRRQMHRMPANFSELRQRRWRTDRSMSFIRMRSHPLCWMSAEPHLLTWEMYSFTTTMRQTPRNGWQSAADPDTSSFPSTAGRWWMLPAGVRLTERISSSISRTERRPSHGSLRQTATDPIRSYLWRAER